MVNLVNLVNIGYGKTGKPQVNIGYGKPCKPGKPGESMIW